jgi:hypothetical protein
MTRKFSEAGWYKSTLIFTVILLGSIGFAHAQTELVYKASINWQKVEAISKTQVTIQVCPEPPMRRGHPASKNIYKALSDAKVNYARLQPWYPYPKLGVAELDEPKNGKTSWDFTHIDPIVIDFFTAAQGRPVMINFSTIPQWMIKTDKPVAYSNDPDEIMWKYSPGNELRDSTLKELVDYYHRLVSWYTKGGFTDEYGQYHKSGYHYKIDYWEVLNENDQDTQHLFSPQQLTKIYDAVVGDLMKLDPDMKFSALALAFPQKGDGYVDYFLNPKNHKPGIPLDMFSYHNYIGADGKEWKFGEEGEKQHYSFFEKADNFLKVVSRLDSIKQKRSPHTKTFVNELGTIPVGGASDPKLIIPDYYWITSNAMFSYAYVGMVKRGIDLLAIAELIDYPGQFAGTTICDWNTGKPNARYWGMRMLRENFGVNDKLVESGKQDKYLLTQGFITKGKRKVLLVNKSNHVITVNVPKSSGSKMEYVDLSTGNNPPATITLKTTNVKLQPHAVAIVKLKNS